MTFWIWWLSVPVGLVALIVVAAIIEGRNDE